jgi:hypothetical protein
MNGFVRLALLGLALALGFNTAVWAESPGRMTPQIFAAFMEINNDALPEGQRTIGPNTINRMAGSYVLATGIDPEGFKRQHLITHLQNARTVYGREVRAWRNVFFDARFPFGDNDEVWVVAYNNKEYVFWNGTRNCPVVRDERTLKPIKPGS